MSFNKNKKRKKPPGAGGRSSAVPPRLWGAMPGPCQDQAGTSRGGEGCGGAPVLPSPPGRCEAIPPPQFPGLFWAAFPWGSLKPAKLLLAAGGARPLPVLGLGAGGWRLLSFVWSCCSPGAGVARGWQGRDHSSPPPPKPTWDQEPCWDHGRGAAPPFLTTAFFSPPAPPPFFFPPSPPCLPCTCLGFLCVFHSVRHGSINQKPLPAPCPLSPAPSRCPSRRSPRAPRHRTASESKKVYLATNQKLDS